jgi:hypothetical protein
LSEQIREVALTEEEKDTILSNCEPEPLLVGGQALAFWAVWFVGRTSSSRIAYVDRTYRWNRAG